MKRTRAEMVALTEGTQVINNNHHYQDKRMFRFGDGVGIVNSWVMTHRNDKQLKEMFGKCSFATNEWEFYTRCWVVDYDEEIYLIYSSEKGTSYEIVVPESTNWESFARDEKLGEKMIGFINHLVGRMLKLEINQKDIAEWRELEKEMQEKRKNEKRN